jgi:hypothetical protein
VVSNNQALQAQPGHQYPHHNLSDHGPAPSTSLGQWAEGADHQPQLEGIDLE